MFATIETGAVSDHELFSAMDRENRERADLSPYEQGTMYRRAVDEKLYPSNRRLAEASASRTLGSQTSFWSQTFRLRSLSASGLHWISNTAKLS